MNLAAITAPTKVAQLTSAQAVEQLLSLVTFSGPILDTTYGNAMFWAGSTRPVIGCDINPERSKTICCNFLALPFADGAFEMVVYDPPFHPTGTTSIEKERFAGLGRVGRDLKRLFQQGLTEASRVSSRFTLVKCQDYINENTPQWMPLWAVDVLGEPYEWLIATRPGKRVSSTWTNVVSLRRNHADYLLFCKQGNSRPRVKAGVGSRKPRLVAA